MYLAIFAIGVGFYYNLPTAYFVVGAAVIWLELALTEY